VLGEFFTHTQKKDYYEDDDNRSVSTDIYAFGQRLYEI